MTVINYEYLKKHNSCNDAIVWLRTQPDIESAWANCERSDWLFWLLEKLNALTEHDHLAISIAMMDTPLHDGRIVEDLLSDERGIAFMALKRQRMNGEIIDSGIWNAAAVYAAAAVAAAAAAAAAADTAKKWQVNKIRELISIERILEKAQS